MKLLLACVVLSCGLAHVYSTECNSQQASTVQQQWTDTFESNMALAAQMGDAAIARMREQNPGATIPARLSGRGITQRIRMGISLLDDLEELDARLARMRDRQPRPHTSPQAFRMLTNNVLATLPQYVGSSYDSAAWNSCLTMLVNRVTSVLHTPPRV